jgi:hypothetical protein
MAENRAAFILRRRRSLGFSKCRRVRTCFNVPSRSILFFNRRKALSTGSLFFNLISLKPIHFLSQCRGHTTPAVTAGDYPVNACRLVFRWGGVNRQKRLKQLAISGCGPHGLAMALPTDPVTLSVQQLEELYRKLSTLRHDINGDLALIVAAAELMKLNPDILQRMLATLMEQPPKIRDKVERFSAEVEKLVGITRP